MKDINFVTGQTMLSLCNCCNVHTFTIATPTVLFGMLYQWIEQEMSFQTIFL